jgi:hypothetical protein
MKKILLLAVVALALTASSCMIGQDGNVYGAYTYDGIACSCSLGGFPSPAYENHYYEISPGTYEIYYHVQDSSLKYYPGPTSSYDYYSVYKVSANTGEFLQDGSDKYFDLYLAYGGLYNEGDSTYFSLSQAPGAKPAPRLGTYSWCKNGLTITVTTSIVQLTADQAAKLHIATLVKK